MKRSDFVNLNRSGKRLETKHFVVLLKPNQVGITRLGVTVSKKVGNSVIRNRVKRIVREFFRLNKHLLPQGHDMVIIARPGAARLDFWKVKEELGEVLFNKNPG